MKISTKNTRPVAAVEPLAKLQQPIHLDYFGHDAFATSEMTHAVMEKPVDNADPTFHGFQANIAGPASRDESHDLNLNDLPRLPKLNIKPRLKELRGEVWKNPEAVHEAQQVEYPAWALTASQKAVFDEKRLKGEDVLSENAVKEIKTLAVGRQTETFKQQLLDREKLMKDFDEKVIIYSELMARRKELEKKLEDGLFKGDRKSALESFIKAKDSEKKAFEDLEMQRIISYPKSGFGDSHLEF